MKTNIQQLIRQSLLVALLGGAFCVPSLSAAPTCVPGTTFRGKCSPPPPPPGTPNFPQRPPNDPIIKPHQDPPKPPTPPTSPTPSKPQDPPKK